jgi:hypothetical protein
MDTQFRARWISKQRSDEVRRAGMLGDGLFLSSCKGFIVVEPKTRPIGDGLVLSHDAAIFELDPTWCTDSPAKVKKAREMLGLDRVPPE